jgi:hypothetical protein
LENDIENFGGTGLDVLFIKNKKEKGEEEMEDTASQNLALENLYKFENVYKFVTFTCYLNYLLHKEPRQVLLKNYYQCRYICKFAIVLYAKVRDFSEDFVDGSGIFNLIGGRFLFKLVMDATSLIKNKNIVFDEIKNALEDTSLENNLSKMSLSFLLFKVMEKEFHSPLVFKKNQVLCLVNFLKHFKPDVLESLEEMFSFRNSYLNSEECYDGYQLSEDVREYSFSSTMFKKYFKTRADFIERDGIAGGDKKGFIPLSLASDFFKWNIKSLLEIKDEFVLKKLVPRYEYFLRKRDYFNNVLKFRAKCDRCKLEDQLAIPSNCYHFYCSTCYIKSMHENSCPMCSSKYAF